MSSGAKRAINVLLTVMTVFQIFDAIDRVTEHAPRPSPPRRPAGPIPIVVVPGIMGTRLAIGAERVLWDPDDWKGMARRWVFATARQKRAWLADTGEVVGALGAGGTDRGTSSLVQSAYGGLLRFLGGLGPAHPVYAVGYDWRRSNGESARTLATAIDWILRDANATQVIVVTHSMGGLVTRAACLDPAVQAKVRGVIHTVQPATGALIAYSRMIHGAEDASSWAEARILGAVGWKYSAVVSGAQGPVELMPTPQYSPDWLRVGGTAPPDGIHASTVWQDYLNDAGAGVLVPWNDRMQVSREEWEEIRDALGDTIRGAEAFHTQLGLRAHPTTWVALSADRPTPTKITLTYDSPIVLVYSEPGDGTVPGISARAIEPRRAGVPAPAQLLVTTGEHGKIFNQSPALLAWIRGAIERIAQ